MADPVERLEDELRLKLMEAEEVADRLRASLRTHFVGPWELTRRSTVTHAEDDGCDCELEDGIVDPRCAESESWPALILTSGEWDGWVLRLDAMEAAIVSAWDDDCDDDEIARRVAYLIAPGLAPAKRVPTNEWEAGRG